MFLITAVAFAGVLFNFKMLFSCVKNKTKYRFLQDNWTVLVCQAVYQVFVLVVNSVNAWTEPDVQHEEHHCSAVYSSVASFMAFFVSGSLMSLAVECRSGACQELELFGTCALSTTAVLALGFTVSVMIRWLSCFCEDFSFYLMAINLIIAMMIVVVLRVAFGSCVELDTTTPKLSMPKTSLMHLCKKSKGTVLFVALFLMCIGVMVTQLVSPQAFQKVLYLVIVNVAVGIALPLTFNDLIGSSIEMEKETRVVVIT